MQTWIRNHLVDLGEEEVAGSMSVKVVSSFKNSFSASSSVREQFKSSNQEYPESIEYSSKAIFVFQQINNVEVCIFSMYVQEYDENANVPSNRLRTYIAYIDSLVYMRPRYVRTSLFQEVLISYLAFCKRKGFLHAHIWACPTTRGGDFIYWCHPSFQKNPGKDRLLQWYMGMAEKAKKEGVVYACKDMYSNQFQHLESTLEQTLPTYFDGDYWISECNRFAAHPPKRGKLSKEAYEESLRGPKFRKRVIDAVNANKDALFEISLQPICFKCEESIVNSTFWCNIENGNGKENDQLFLCSSCFENDTKHKKDFKKIAPPSFVRILPSAEEKKLDNTEISCSFLDHRADLLKNCEMYHYQFDSFRRAKYSTMMLIYQIYSTQVVKQSKNESTR
jgi:E1A/CREB-binding protein